MILVRSFIWPGRRISFGRLDTRDSPRNVQVVNSFIQYIIRMNQPLNVLVYLRPAELDTQQTFG